MSNISTLTLLLAIYAFGLLFLLLANRQRKVARALFNQAMPGEDYLTGAIQSFRDHLRWARFFCLIGNGSENLRRNISYQPNFHKADSRAAKLWFAGVVCSIASIVMLKSQYTHGEPIPFTDWQKMACVVLLAATLCTWEKIINAFPTLSLRDMFAE